MGSVTAVSSQFCVAITVKPLQNVPTKLFQVACEYTFDVGSRATRAGTFD